jgi:DMSO/TMAO reductase YedYZ molybdopterin-dependent catalytic subunit
MEQTKLRDGKVILSEEPLVLETPLENLHEFITPTKLFYVRSHFAIPEIDKNKWRLQIEGEVDKPFEIDFDELARLDTCTIPINLSQCPQGLAYIDIEAVATQNIHRLFRAFAAKKVRKIS